MPYKLDNQPIGNLLYFDLKTAQNAHQKIMKIMPRDAPLR